MIHIGHAQRQDCSCRALFAYDCARSGCLCCREVMDRRHVRGMLTDRASMDTLLGRTRFPEGYDRRKG